MMDAMRSVDSEPLWSILDQKGTQTMMRQVLGEAGSATDFETLKKRLLASWYSMNFQHGVKFDLTISTGDSFASATLSSLLTAGLTVRKMSGTEAEKQALTGTSIASDSGRLSIHFSTTDAQFNSLSAIPALHQHGALSHSSHLPFNGPADGSSPESLRPGFPLKRWNCSRRFAVGSLR